MITSVDATISPGHVNLTVDFVTSSRWLVGANDRSDSVEQHVVRLHVRREADMHELSAQ